MITINCDICKKVVDKAIRLEVLDGEHPHNGSTMYKDIDCCLECICEIPRLCSRTEFDDICKFVLEK